MKKKNTNNLQQPPKDFKQFLYIHTHILIMTEPEVAPYGGFLVKSLEDESENLKQLQQQSIEITTAQGTIETIRPEAIKITGVDNLSTNDIQNYVDYYINYTTTIINPETNELKYELVPFDQLIEFKIEWIDDSSVNIAFKTIDDCYKGLQKISESPILEKLGTQEYIEQSIIERKGKSYNPIIDFKKHQNLANRLKLANESKNTDNNEVKTEELDSGDANGVGASTGDMEEDEVFVELIIRQSFQLDRKVKNASQYSRYYLIHGEPERRPRKHLNPQRRNKYPTGYRSRRKNEGNDDDQEDLFADKLKEERQSRSNNRNIVVGGDDDEEDLFADKLKQSKRDRSRSPMRIDSEDVSYRQR